MKTCWPPPSASSQRSPSECGTAPWPDRRRSRWPSALKRYRVKKHFEIEISDDTFTYQRTHDQIDAEAALDGFMSSERALPRKHSPPPRSSLLQTAQRSRRDFKTIKGPELQIRPIAHRLEDRVRAHVFLCMLACHLTWHLKDAWAELLFKDQHPPLQPDPVAKATRSPAAERKARTRRTTREEPAHSFRSLLDELSTQTLNTIRLHGTQATIQQLTTPTAL